MKKHLVSLLFLLVAFLVGRLSNAPTAKAQATQAATFYGGGPVSTCAKPATGTVFLCVGTDDIVISKNGSIPVSLFSTPIAGVTSWNGQIGAVTYTPPAPPVTSVNGKTGAVVLSAITTAPSTTLQ